MPTKVVKRSPMLVMKDIRVRFGSLVANDDVNFDIHKGEVHALLGENGAGKTTLMKVLIGLVERENGSISLNNEEIEIDSAITAMNLGIGMVHQHFMLIPTLSVVQNICIGFPDAGYPFPNLRRVSRELKELALLYDLQVNPEATVSELSVGAQQRVEIIKALYRGANLLILDEPTSVLTPQETVNLFNVMRKLTKQGKSIIFISHKLDEVKEISDRVTILRRGKVIDTRHTQETNPKELARLMVGRDIELPHVQTVLSDQPPIVIETHNLEYSDNRGVEVLKGIDLQVGKGEIHGIAGVDGNGQDELARLLAGTIEPSEGRILLNGNDITSSSPGKRIQAGIAHIPGDRQYTGLVLDLDINANAVIEMVDQPPYSKRFLLNHEAINDLAKKLIASYDIRSSSTSQKVETLSGGNQQKLVLARELVRAPIFIIAVQPTRGLDIGATEFVWEMLLEQCKQGSSILLISTELDEVMALSHRISVIYEGNLMSTVRRENAKREELGLQMAGQSI